MVISDMATRHRKENKKRSDYNNNTSVMMAKHKQLVQSYTFIFIFIPFAVETLGPINNAGLELLNDLKRRIS